MENKRSWSVDTKNTRNIGVRLPRDVWRHLAQYAACHGLTVTDCVIEAIKQYLKTKGYDY